MLKETLLYGSVDELGKQELPGGSFLFYSAMPPHNYVSKRMITPELIAEMIRGELFANDPTLTEPALVPLDMLRPNRLTLRPLRDEFDRSEYSHEFDEAIRIVSEGGGEYADALQLTLGI